MTAESEAAVDADPLARRWDLFPVSASGPGLRERMARAAIFDGHLRVWVVPRGTRDPVVTAEATIVAMEVPSPRGRTWIATDENGGVWTFQRAAGCGCGHPLRKIDPWAEG